MIQGDRTDNLITAFHSSLLGVVNLNAEEIADALWLAQYLPTIVIAKEVTEEITEEVAKESLKEVRSELEDNTVEDVIEDVSEIDSESLEEPQVSVTVQAPDSDRLALPIRIPDSPALSKTLLLSRSLRPLMRKVKSSRRSMLDEEATIVQIVDQDIWSPVMQPMTERWLDVAIVVEETNLLEVWEETIAEFQTLMERHGAFRDVRSWQVVTANSLKLYRRNGRRKMAAVHGVGELRDAVGQRLIVFVSDCTSVGWATGRVPGLLQDWARHCPVTVLQLLPERFWERSALGNGEWVWLGSQLPGVRNDRLTVESDELRKPEVKRDRLTLPVVTLDEGSLGQWAKLVAGNEDCVMAGVVIDVVGAPEREWEQEKGLTAEQLVRRWRRSATPVARKLAQMMAAVPVSLAVIRLIQRSLLPEATTVQVAEVFLSGLLVDPARNDPPKNDLPKSPLIRGTMTSAVTSEMIIENPVLPLSWEARGDRFFPGVREILLSSVFVSDTEDVMEVVADDVLAQLPQDVRDRITADIEQRLGRSMRSFEAFLLPDLLEGVPGDVLLPFASITRKVLQSLGSDYQELVDRVDRGPVSLVEAIATPSIELVNEIEQIDQLEPFEFEIVDYQEVVDEPVKSELLLIEHTFEIAELTIETESNLFGLQKKSNIKVNLTVKNDWQYVETLEPGLTLELIEIPAGSFSMGSPKDELEARENERPQHKVNISEFYMGKYPVTQAQWRFVVGLPEIDRSLEIDPSGFKGEMLPVENVSWLDATEFCKRLSLHTDRAYRLPTEAQWEYACRAGTRTPFHFGETIDASVANYAAEDRKIDKTTYPGKYGKGRFGEYRKKTTVVGSLRAANNRGLSDMHGNVWEWCEDHWHESYENAPTDGSAWLDQNSPKDSQRLLRGGSWSSIPRYCRSAVRDRSSPVSRNGTFGFRVSFRLSRTLS